MVQQSAVAQRVVGRLVAALQVGEQPAAAQRVAALLEAARLATVDR